MLTPQRTERLEYVLDGRTEELAVVIEGMVDLGNVGAVMRSADAFGVQPFHTIDTAGAYKRSRRTSQGADKWLDRYRWDDPEACVAHLHAEGYVVVAADLVEARPITDVDLSRRAALVFGNELSGLTEDLRSIADEAAVIPMHGFAESLNISVAAAVTLAEARRQRTERFGKSGDLTAERRDRIRAVWYAKSVREYRRVVQRALDDGYEPAGT
jgi:tRNA (guanosine-2'-O-)-methyltransferase